MVDYEFRLFLAVPFGFLLAIVGFIGVYNAVTQLETVYFIIFSIVTLIGVAAVGQILE